MFRATLIAAAATVALLGSQASAADTVGDNSVVTNDGANSAATAGNFAAQTLDATVKYTGDINFGIGGGNSGTTTIADFLNSAGGTWSSLSVLEDTFLATTLLSQGTYVQTTFFQILGNFGTEVLSGVINHDDGVTLVEATSGGVSAPPTSSRFTDFTADAGDFTLFYAAANGNPSILKITAELAPELTPVPLPAGAVLLFTGLAGLGFARRRKTAA
jgi:hypothetical protein